ncbi:MAG: M14 family metallopeptidase [Chloroflexota bacterium]
MIGSQKIILLTILVVINLLLVSVGLWYIYHIQSSFALSTLVTPTQNTQKTAVPSINIWTPSPSPSSLPSPTFIPPRSTVTPTSLPYNSIQIGSSVGGKPILIYSYGKGEKTYLIVAGIHGGNEYNTVLLAEQLMAFLSSHPEAIPKDKTLFILPNLNPDGFERSWDIYGRANDHGVDLNHNFPFQWAQDWKRDGCWRYLHLGGGDAPASEPETQALMGFILTHPIQALISYHSAALGIFPGGQPPYPPSLSLARAIAKVSDYPYPPIDTGCQVSGNLTDWAASLGIASVDIELSNHRDTDFEQNLQILETFLRWKR